jgi:Spy/CpxP family protein refolding chaperone
MSESGLPVTGGNEMKTSTKLLGIALVVLVAAAGVAAADVGLESAAADDRYGYGPDNGTGSATDADRPFDGSNSPWLTGDERLDRFQDRFDLTDEQVSEIRNEVTAMLDDGADRDAVRAQVESMLADFGVDDPTLGPVDGERLGTGPHGPADGTGNGSNGSGNAGADNGAGSGPHGPADGSCGN